MAAVEGDFKALGKLLDKLTKLGSSETKRALMGSLAEEYRTFMMDCFKQSRSPYGQAWAPLKWRSSVGGSGQKPLLNTGIMRSATTPAVVTESYFTVVVPEKYASTHQFGAVIVPKNAKALAFPGPVSYVQKVSKSGKTRTSKVGSGMMFRKRVVIPARPFAMTDGIPPELAAGFEEATSDFFKAFFGS